jgi:NitT/TauT family transport system substrate-binding protein
MERPAVTVIVVIAAIVAAVVGSLSCSQGTYSGPPESITLGYTPSEAAGLLYVAEERGFFTANGVKIIQRKCDTGTEAMEALIKGDVEIAGMSESAFVGKAFSKREVSIYANIDRLEWVYLIALKDRGIQTVADLKGKKIGLPRRTIAEFHLGRTLELNGMSMQDVMVVETLPPASLNAMTSGGLDAVVVWNPIAYQISQQMTDRVILLRVQSNQPGYALAVARNDWIASHKGVLTRSLKAIAQAEQYIINHPMEAKALVQKRMNYDAAFMDSVWPENQFSLSLDHSLITAMEDEARWMIKNKLTTEKQIPDFMNYIYVDALKAIKPEAVNIIR